MVENFFDLDFETAIQLSKELGFYEKTLDKMNLLALTEDISYEFYRSLLE